MLDRMRAESWVAPAITLLLVALPTAVEAQESVRPSTTGASATPITQSANSSFRPSLTGGSTAQTRNPISRPTSYNFTLGPVLFDLVGDLGVEFNDNVNLSDNDPQPDVILRPSLTLRSFWQATELNALRLDVGVGYAKYLNGQASDANTLLIAPGSQLSFDIFIGDFRINVHDYFSVTQNPASEVTLSNTSEFTKFENTIGVSALWDLNDFKLIFGYDHYNFKAITENFTYLDRSEEQFTFSAGLLISDAATVGVDLGAAIIDYAESLNNDALSLNIGPFYETQISNFLKLRLSAGYQRTSFDSEGVDQETGDSSNPFGLLTVSHRLNDFVTQTLSAGYQSQLGITSSSLDLAFAQWRAIWRMNRQITLNFDAFFEDAQESGGPLAEKAQRYGGGLAFGYQLTKKVGVGFRYQFSIKDSNLPARAYIQNLVALNFSYDF